MRSPSPPRIEILNPRFLVAVGAFAESRVHAIVGDDTTRFTVGRILHPSGANPKASKNWSQQAERDLPALGVRIP